jgi:phospholipid transport system substrate-binding protein
MNHRLWLPVALLALASGTASAQTPAQAPAGPGYGGYGPAYPQAPAYPRIAPAPRPGDEAVKTLRAGMDKLLDYLTQKDAPNKLQAAAFLDREIAPYFDFAYMAKWVAGPTYAGMSESDRKALAAKIEAEFLSGLASQLGKYDGQQVRYLRPRPGPSGSVKVPVGILRPGAYPDKMTFRMYKAADGWKVYDVEANGRSVAAHYRTQMARTAQAALPGGTPGPRPAPTQAR